MTSLDDIQSLRQSIFDSSVEALSNLEPVKQGDYQLSIKDVSYTPVRFTDQDIKTALLEKQTLGVPLKGTVEFVGPDKTVRKKTILTLIPYLTDRGTFIIDGVEYFITNQQRLRPGIYVFRKFSGEPSAYVNLAHGHSHRYILDPKSKIFYLQIGQANLPLYPLLKALGITDDQLKQVWGHEVWQANIQKDSDKYLKQILDKMRVKDVSEITGFSVEPDVIQRTLGVASDRLTPEVILASTSKVIKLFKNEVEEDDRDALTNQSFLTPDLLLKESLSRSQPILRRLLWKLMRRPDSSSIVSHFLSPRVLFLFREARLANLIDSANPLEIIDSLYRVTRMGEGGISSTENIPDSARDIHPTHFGFIDPVTTPESLKVGVDTRLTINTRKVGNQLYSKFRNIKTGEEVWITPTEAYESYIVFPGELERQEPYVFGFYRGKETVFPKEKAQYILPTPIGIFGPISNLIPFKNATFPQRLAMGSRMILQALPLVGREAPLVQTVDYDKVPFVKKYSKFAGAIASPVDGVISAITDQAIVIRDSSGAEHDIPLMINVPYSRLTGITQTPIVGVGQEVKKGQTIAASNYTDNDGVVAVGTNAKVAYLPTGDNYEDAFVISESFAKRLSSDHLFTYELEKTDEITIGKDAYVANFPGKITADQLKNYDAFGCIKRGTKVTKGTPLILAVREMPMSTIGRKRLFLDSSVEWEWDDEGVVTDVVRRPDGSVSILVRSIRAMQQGDKLSGLYGNKGIVVIKPDNEMPKDEEGNTVDVLANPLGVISRGNVGQIYEALLGKVARKLGQPVYIDDFQDSGRLHEFVTNLLKKHGVKPTEKLYDPVTGKYVEALTGIGYFLKLHHLVEDKLQGIGMATAYSSEGIPMEGEEGTSKRLGLLDLNALLAHSAFNVITDAALLRGQQDEDFWRTFLSGHNITYAKVPQTWEKFVSMLKAAGINPIIGPKNIKIFALTNKDIDTLTGNRVIDSSDTVYIRDSGFKPVPGGLFDERLTGGLAGEHWAAIKLPYKLPNPVMVEPLARILEIGVQELEDIIVGKKSLPKKFGGEHVTGPEAVYRIINQLNIDKEIEKVQAELPLVSRSRADVLRKKLNYLIAAKKFNTHPRDWFWDKVPVLPPKFRPISALSNGVLIINDANYFYKMLFDLSQELSSLEDGGIASPEDREKLWQTLTALVGLDEPKLAKLREQEVKGILRTVVGPSPKAGMVQYKMLGMNTSMVGRGVVSPNPALDIDEIGIPREMAFTIYKPFIVRDLVRRGQSLLNALRMVRDEHPEALRTLEKVVKERPVIVNRAPVWHKYGIMAFKPVLTNAKTVEVCPLVTAGFGMDFDGNCVIGDSKITLVFREDQLRSTPIGGQWLDEFFKKFPDAQQQKPKTDGCIIYTVPIKDIPVVGGFYRDKNGAFVFQLPANLQVLTFDWDAYEIEAFDVTALTLEQNQPCVKVTTEDNHEVIVTENESLAVFDPVSYKIIKAAPKDSIGKFVITMKRPAEMSGEDFENEVIPIPAELQYLFGYATELPRGQIRQKLSGDYITPSDFEHHMQVFMHFQYILVRGGVYQPSWSKIKSVESVGTHDVYDLIVPYTSTFFANNLLVYDTAQFHVPVSDKAVEEAYSRMLPSRNLFSENIFGTVMTVPSQEYLLGLWKMSRIDKDKPLKIFRSAQEALDAFNRGEIEIDQPVRILQGETR